MKRHLIAIGRLTLVFAGLTALLCIPWGWWNLARTICVDLGLRWGDLGGLLIFESPLMVLAFVFGYRSCLPKKPAVDPSHLPYPIFYCEDDCEG